MFNPNFTADTIHHVVDIFAALEDNLLCPHLSELCLQRNKRTINLFAAAVFHEMFNRVCLRKPGRQRTETRQIVNIVKQESTDTINVLLSDLPFVVISGGERCFRDGGATSEDEELLDGFGVVNGLLAVLLGDGQGRSRNHGGDGWWARHCRVSPNFVVVGFGFLLPRQSSHEDTQPEHDAPKQHPLVGVCTFWYVVTYT